MLLNINLKKKKITISLNLYGKGWYKIAITQKRKLTAYEEELISAIKRVSEYKLICESNIVIIYYKTPENLYESTVKLQDISNNIWKVYWQIAHDIIIEEKKNSLDEITVGLYLEKHPKLKDKYDEYGGYNTILKGQEYVKEQNLEGYIQELKKWNIVISLAKMKFPINEKLSEYVDMSVEDIYNEFETLLNHTFINVDTSVKSYNACEGLYEYIDECDKGKAIGLPLSNCDILNREISGLNLNGNVYLLGANSGVGKSTTAINYIIPSAFKYNEKVVMIINEEDQTKVQRELLIWVANNIFKADIPKYILRDGKFTDEVKEILHKSADWLQNKKDNRNITVIPLEKYSAKIAIKIIKKYSSMGVRIFILDTLKESCDAVTDDIYKSMTRDMVDLYDTIKPSAKNVCLFVTYQLGKASIKMRYYTNNEIGLAKSIVDTASVNLMIRKPFEDEYEGGKREITGYKLSGKNGKTKIPFKLNREKHYMITFIPKNRFGSTDEFQIISEYDLSTNIHKDIGICNIIQDF